MKYDFNMNRESGTPVYRQIMEQINMKINRGILKAGDKLPPERELAHKLHLSRGTITKAYGELERAGIIEVIRGSGSFIAKGQDVLDKGRKERAISLINHTIKELEHMQFSFHEMKIFFDLMVMEREKQLEGVPIATVDCNPEALNIFKNQIGYIAKVEMTRFLIEEILRLPDLTSFFEPYKLIITTSNHYEEVVEMLPEYKDRIVEAAVSPSQQTVIDIAKIGIGENIGILCYTERFYQIIQSALESFGVKDHQFDYRLVEGMESGVLQDYLQHKQYLLIPADSMIRDKYPQVIDGFEESGGRIIHFEYQIQRGTLIYIEERIYHILNEGKYDL